MFGPQKKSSTEENKNDSLNLSQKKDFDIEEMPIHTMREDLENLGKTVASHGAILPPPQEKKIIINQETLTPRQKTSPFLNLNSEDLPKSGNLTNESQRILKTEDISSKFNFNTDKETRPVFSQTREQKNDFEDAPLLTKTSGIFNINWRLIFFFASSLIVVAILISISYYFPKNKIELSKILQNPFSAEPNISPATENPVAKEPAIEKPTEKPILSYSQTSPNYLRLEVADSDAEKIKTILQQYIQKVSQESYAMAIEFVVTDQQNAPLAFSDFANKIGLKLSSQVMENLGSNFSLFIYNDVSVTRIGLSVDMSMESKGTGKLATALLQEEETLANEISPLFFTTDYEVVKNFGSSKYAGTTVRFQNIISPDNLSVDYAVDKNKLLIGTTKLTLRAIIDRVNNIAPQE